MFTQIQKELRKVANKDKAKILAKFFKTGKGEYGEGDKFLGVVVPEQRRIVKEVLRSWTSSSFEVQLRKTDKAVRNQGGKVVRSRIWLCKKRLLTTLQKLLQSKFHEDRLTALLVLVELYKKAESKIKKQIFNFYLKNIPHINNWDLVDLSAPNIVGDYLLNFFNDKKEVKNFLLKLAKSKNLWSRRVAVLASFPFIKNGEFEEIFSLTDFLIFTQHESQDLMHKALGWMLREVGKRDIVVLQKFLSQYASRLPRVTLRYAIERMDESERKKFLAL